MSYTPVQNRFWSDGWVRQLNALDRYLFLYLLTNGRAKLTGIYELPLDLMAAECGIDEKDLRLAMLQRLEPKVYYKEGWVIMVNYSKHRIGGGHKYNQGVKANYEELPPKIQEIAKELGYPIDTLSIDYSRFPTRIDKNRIDNTAAKAEPLEITEESEDNAPPKKTRAANKDYDSLISWLENLTGVRIVNKVKQYTHLSKAKAAGISPTRLKNRASELWEKDWYQVNGLDWGGVVSSFDRKA